MRGKLFFNKLILFFISLALIGLAVNLIVESRLGGDSITVLYMGLSNLFSVAYGTSAYIYHATLILVSVIFARKYVGLGTFMYSSAVGLFVYLFEYLFIYLDMYPEGIISRYGFFAVGQILLAFGLAIMISVKIGINGLDCIILVLRDRFSFSYRTLKVMMDLFITALGYALGGLVGIGTVISVITLGGLIQYFIELFQKHDLFYSNHVHEEIATENI